MPSAPEICTLSLHDALPISMEEAPRLRTLSGIAGRGRALGVLRGPADRQWRSEEHTSELQSLRHRVCRLPPRSALFPYTTLFRSRWKKHRVFERSVELREGAEPWVFYEGPPTAN